jgi:hypothetical protein
LGYGYQYPALDRVLNPTLGSPPPGDVGDHLLQEQNVADKVLQEDDGTFFVLEG